jgi:hypothetical protein
MKNLAEVLHFFDVAIATGSQIAADHGAKIVVLEYGPRVEHLPPSIGSGVGQLTESLFFSVGIVFQPVKLPVLRTRKFTIYNPNGGDEVWPSGHMQVGNGLCHFDLQVGNVTNTGWGVVASFRNGRLTTLVEQLVSLQENPPMDRIRKASTLPVNEVRTFGL